MRFEVAPLPLDVVVCFFLWTGIVPSLWEFVWNVSRNGICLYYYLVYPSLGRLYFTHNSGWHLDLLYKENIPSFCLVTGDQDFTALVLRLRNQGCQVYCIGRPSKSDALAKVCTAFISVEQFSASVVPTPKQVKTAQKKSQPAKVPANKSHRDPALTELLTQAVGKIMLEKKLEWVSLPRLGSCLKQLNPQFQAKTYGHKSLPELIKTCTDLFEIRPQGNHLEVRLKARNTG